MKSLVFFGNERLATNVTTDCPTLRSLIAAGYQVKAVVVNNEDGRSRKNRQLEIEVVAAKHKIPLLTPANSRELETQLADIKADFAVLAAYGKIVPQAVIDVFTGGVINIHPSLLPTYRGPTPIESAILNGDTKTGVSIMKITAKMDAGPVYLQVEQKLSQQEKKQDLADVLNKLGAQTLIKNLDDILAGKIAPAAQDESQVSISKLIKKSDGHIDWTKASKTIEHQVRAYQGWPGSHTELAGSSVIITEASLVPPSIPLPASCTNPAALFKCEGKLAVCCGQGALIIDKLKPAGKNEMTGSAWLAGHPI